MTLIAPHIEAFLRGHLARHRGASQHTCDSYAYSFPCLFEFASKPLQGQLPRTQPRGVRANFMPGRGRA